jgi:hypothetical protein
VDVSDFSDEIQKRHPLRDETSTEAPTKRPPNPTDLDRISDETA